MATTATTFIASDNQKTPYVVAKSRWFNRHAQKRIRIAFSFYSPDGNEVSIPIASISAYLKSHFDFLDIELHPILIGRFPTESTPDKFVARLMAFNADIVAFSLMSPHWLSTLPYLKELKKALPDTTVVVGGYQAMLSREESISNPNVDFICVGDGEFAMANLVSHLRGISDGQVEGMWERMIDGSVFRTEPHQISDLNLLPFPDYDLFAGAAGFSSVVSSIFGPKGKTVLPVMTGRGCPYRCTYCCNTPLLDDWKDKKTFLRKYDPEKLVEEIVRLKSLYGFDYIEFWDELFLSNLKFVKAFFPLYKERVKLPFSINSRVEVMNEKFCTLAADAGCHTIWFGIESGDEKYRSNVLGRKMTNRQIIEAAENCKKAGINRLTFNIVGMPNETKENIRETLKLNEAIAPEFFFFFPYIPLEGTPLYETAQQEDLLLPRKTNLHYLSGAQAGEFVLNLRENPELLTQKEYSELCNEMSLFQRTNNRLSYIGESLSESVPPNPAPADPEPNPTIINSAPARLRGTQQPNSRRTETDLRKAIRLSSSARLSGRKVTLFLLCEELAEYLHDTYRKDEFWSVYRATENLAVTLKQLKEGLKKHDRIPLAQRRKIEWVIFAKDGKKARPIGFAALVDLMRPQSRAEFLVGIVNEEDRHPGYGLEASLLVIEYSFNILHLNKLVSYVYGENSGAQENTLQLGFSREGFLKQHFRKKGSNVFVDVHQNAIMASEFRANQRLARLSKKLLGRDIVNNCIKADIPAKPQAVTGGEFNVNVRYVLNQSKERKT